MSEVTVIIPTLGRRPSMLRRAIDSIKIQCDVKVSIIVVLNGNKYSQSLLNDLKQDPKINLLITPIASPTYAFCLGRKHVRTPFFSCLDDDDEYLEDALIVRKNAMESSFSCDVVVTNGYTKKFNQREKTYRDHDFNLFQADPLLSLMKINWLASCGALFRTERVTLQYFDPHQNVMEWTKVAFHLALERNVKFVNLPTYIINKTSDSLSDSEVFVKAVPELLTYFMNVPGVRSDIVRLLKKKRTVSYDSLANYYFSRYEYLEGFKQHLKCLTNYSGCWYLTKTPRYLMSCFVKQRYFTK